MDNIPLSTTNVNGHIPVDKETARAILSDLLTDAPTYVYTLDEIGEYGAGIRRILDVRKNYGQEAAKRTWADLETNDDVFHDLFKTIVTQQNYPALPEMARLPVGLLPDVSPWITDYLTYSRSFSPEGYKDFHLACALWILSTVAARRIYVPLADRVYTPLAIALVARTSLFAKTTTVKAGVKLLRASGLHWLLGDDETTPQKLLSDMAGFVPNNFSDLDFTRQAQLEQRVGMAGQRGWYYDEFNQLIAAMTRQGPMAEFAGLLRKLDGCPDEYKYSTKGGGQEIIEKPYLSLIANTTPANLRAYAAKGGEFWNDGFWARFAFIAPPPNDFRTETMRDEEVLVPDHLARQLRDWHRRLDFPRCSIAPVVSAKGNETGRYEVERTELKETCIKITKEAYQAYNCYREALRSMIAESSSYDLDGSYVRLPDKALRIAALITSLEDGNAITLDVWTVAQEMAEMFRINLHELYSQVSTAQEEEPLEDVLIEFFKKHPDTSFTAREIYQNVRKVQVLGTKGIRDLLVGLERSGISSCKREGRKECYSLSH